MPQHLHKAFVGGFVKTIELFDLFNPRRIHALASAVARATGSRALATAVTTLQLCHHLLDWPAWDELDDRKRQQQNAKQGGNHQQQALHDIQKHVNALRQSWRVLPTRWIESNSRVGKSAG